MEDSRGRERFGIGRHPDPGHWRADLHNLYLSHPELCTHCTCAPPCQCPTYTELWEKFLEETGQEQARKSQMLDQLSAWHDWAQGHADQGRLSPHQVQLCYGPQGAAEVYDRANVGQVQFVCSRLEGSKKAKDSVVLMMHNGELCAGRVSRFLSHTAPGGSGLRDDDLNIAHVHWYQFTPSDQAAMVPTLGCAAAIDPALSCPVFGKKLVDNDPEGNMCLVEQLLPCKLAALPYKHGGRFQGVIVSRFANFMDSLQQ